MLVSLLVFQLHDISVTRLPKCFICTFLFILFICSVFIDQVINGWYSVILIVIGMFMVGHMVSICENVMFCDELSFSDFMLILKEIKFYFMF